MWFAVLHFSKLCRTLSSIENDLLLSIFATKNSKRVRLFSSPPLSHPSVRRSTLKFSYIITHGFVWRFFHRARLSGLIDGRPVGRFIARARTLLLCVHFLSAFFRPIPDHNYSVRNSHFFFFQAWKIRCTVGDFNAFFSRLPARDGKTFDERSRENNRPDPFRTATDAGFFPPNN